MDKKTLINEIRQFCCDNANAENVIKAKRFFKEAPDCYGLTQVQINEKAKQLLKDKSLTLDVVLKAAPELLKSGMYEEISAILLIFNGFEKQYTKKLLSEIETWFTYSINNWAHADTLGMFILPKFLKNKLIMEDDFESWLKSPYKFQRRCVPVTLIKVLKERENFQYLFDFLEPLMKDPEREVHQGMGWFLRECWKVKPSETEDFLMKWKDKAPRLIINYAAEKMTAENKARFKKDARKPD
jgi:3-methyladenine DNA glycosylase AlkD